MKTHELAVVSSTAITDLHERLDRFRLVPVPQIGKTTGIDHALLDSLIRHWGQGYNWPLHEGRIASYPWVETEHTKVPIWSIIRQAAPTAPVVLLLHGWPDSVLRFEKLLQILSDITLVVPALPGFPFAAPVEGGGMSSVQMADAIAAAMQEFGFQKYIVSAGDVGCDVAEAIAARHGSSVSALHLTDLSQYHFLSELPDDLDDNELAYVEYGRGWQEGEGGYMHLQSTRPGTLAVALGDSPAGLAAWIVEKLVLWTDSHGDLATRFTIDEALTWVSAYWFNKSIGTSFTPYADSSPKDWERINVPTVVTVFPKDLVNAPRRFFERFFTVADWREFQTGGHFAAWEQPEDYAWGIHRAIALQRTEV